MQEIGRPSGEPGEPALTIEGRGGAWIRLQPRGASARAGGLVHRFALGAIGHVERVGGDLTLRWGLPREDDPGRVTLGISALTAGDRLDEVERFLDASSGHLYSVADEDGIRYSRALVIADLQGAGVGPEQTTQKLVGRTRRFRVRTGPRRVASVLRLTTDGDRYWVQSGGGFFIRRESTTVPVLGLVGNQLVLASGLVLGTVHHNEHGGATIALGDGCVCEVLVSSRSLMRDGQKIGSYRGKNLRLLQAERELVVLAFFLALLDRDHEQTEEGDLPERRNRVFWFCVVGSVVLASLPRVMQPSDWLDYGFLLVLAVMIVVVLPRRRPRRPLAGGPTEDSAERRRQKSKGSS